ncbi:MAG: hypothetical protein ACJAVK_000883 [Akkermansiaceae bacterium]
MLAYPTLVMKVFSVLLSVIGFGVCSCERHEWHTDPEKEPKSSDTINLFIHAEHTDHGKDGEHHTNDGEAHHGKEGDYAKPEAAAPASE